MTATKITVCCSFDNIYMQWSDTAKLSQKAVTAYILR